MLPGLRLGRLSLWLLEGLRCEGGLLHQRSEEDASRAVPRCMNSKGGALASRKWVLLARIVSITSGRL